MKGKLSRNIESIQSAAKRGADLSRQLLALARREMISPKLIDVNSAIMSIEKMLVKLIGEDITLKVVPEGVVEHQD